MSTHRLIITAAPTATIVARASALLDFAALTAAGHEATARGSYESAEVGARASAIRAHLVATITDAAPTDERTARMLAALVKTAGGRAMVVAA